MEELTKKQAALFESSLVLVIRDRSVRKERYCYILYLFYPRDFPLGLTILVVTLITRRTAST
jgi:hypothetical protein